MRRLTPTASQPHSTLVTNRSPRPLGEAGSSAAGGIAVDCAIVLLNLTEGAAGLAGIGNDTMERHSFRRPLFTYVRYRRLLVAGRKRQPLARAKHVWPEPPPRAGRRGNPRRRRLRHRD